MINVNCIFLLLIQTVKITIEEKNGEINKLNKKVNDAKKEFVGIKNEVDMIEREKARLAEENVNCI